MIRNNRALKETPREDDFKNEIQITEQVLFPETRKEKPFARPEEPEQEVIVAEVVED
ncbi:hypothetical protein JXB28_00390 [Candidatus Woesearchaeota archaeon]|nr:hypothetical protein [Candidatus Woesearchaeota archaeon]